MADFCKQCAIELLGGDLGELANLSTPEHTAAGLYANVLCEGCGPIQVDHTGLCISENCPEHGKDAPHDGQRTTG